jgi:hypothetical protein
MARVFPGSEKREGVWGIWGIAVTGFPKRYAAGEQERGAFSKVSTGPFSPTICMYYK